MLDLPPHAENLRDIVQAIRQLIQGRSNATGTVTLSANTTTTQIKASSGNANAIVLLTPTTANAAGEQAAGAMFATVDDASTVTVTHANNAQTDRTFYYMVVGG